MSKVKSLSIGYGDMFYIKHNSDSFSIIDCCLSEGIKESIVDELKNESQGKHITRFISTHPDEDHIQQLDYLDDKMPIANFYCVKNEVKKKDETSGFKRYCKLRDSSEKAFYLFKGCGRKWINMEGNDKNGYFMKGAGIHILWPKIKNQHYEAALNIANEGGSPNNISPIITYQINEEAKYQWMGDLETDFMENIKDEVEWSKVHILFAPHHGRDSGKIPQSILDILDPDLIVVGEAPSNELNYYKNYNTITQNLAGDITFINDDRYNSHLCVKSRLSC